MPYHCDFFFFFKYFIGGNTSLPVFNRVNYPRFPLNGFFSEKTKATVLPELCGKYYAQVKRHQLGSSEPHGVKKNKTKKDQKHSPLTSLEIPFTLFLTLTQLKTHIFKVEP